MKITHITSAHSRQSVRIVHKMAASSVGFGHDVCIVLADGKKNEVRNGVSFFDVGVFKNKYLRFFISSLKVILKARAIKTDIYHLHDPDLLLWALLLRGKGKKVIFDAHEDYPLQIRHKPYLNKYMCILLSALFGFYEIFICKRLSGVIAATPSIKNKFDRHVRRTIDIKNYPLKSEFSFLSSQDNYSNDNYFKTAYVGGITSVRGIREVIAAHELLDQKFMLKLAGRFLEPNMERDLHAMTGWLRVEYEGICSRSQIVSLLEEANCGIVTLHPIANYLEALPIKMFEYMAARLPFIASDFPIIRSIVEHYNCGVLVNPQDPAAIASAIKFLHDNPVIAKQMGENGRAAFETRLNFDVEAIRLNDFYNS